MRRQERELRAMVREQIRDQRKETENREQRAEGSANRTESVKDV